MRRQIKLIGESSNRSGLGARVTVTTALGDRGDPRKKGRPFRTGIPGVSYTKWQDGKSGYLGQSDLPLYFGLGDNPGIHSIEVLWPSGIRQVMRHGLQSGTLIKIHENPRY